MQFNNNVVRKALKLLRHVLEKQTEGYILYLRKDKNVIEHML